MNYRNASRHALKRARAALESNDDQNLKYAALELRMAMESLTYDRAKAYKDEFPPDEYETWQPRKVMAVLLEIDATADKDSTLSYGLEETPGQPPSQMTMIGTETVLNMETLRRHYDALGSFLHVPTLKQTKSGKGHDHGKLRMRCTEIAEYFDKVLTSPVHNVTLGNFATIDCAECGKPIRKRIPATAETVEAECFSCNASYTIKDIGGGQVHWESHIHEVACGNNDCGHKIQIWRREFAAGVGWTCPDCAGQNTITYGLRHEPPQSSAPTEQESSE